MHFTTVVSSLALAAGVYAQTLTQVLTQNADQLSNLANLVNLLPGAAQSLERLQNVTILAPNNAAVTKFLARNPGAAGNKTAVGNLLSYHVLRGVWGSAAITAMPLFGESMLVLPGSDVTGGQKVELVKTNGTAMVLSGFAQSSKVVAADIKFNGGVIHVLDTVLTVPGMPSTTAVDMGLTALAGAVMKANLASTVDTASNLTIFAPSNEAFGNIASILRSISAQDLAGVLAYHAVPSVQFSTALATGRTVTLKTLGGQNINVVSSNGGVWVNSAKVVLADVITSNGVVHVIDNVLNPANPSAAADPSKTTGSPAFPGALGSSDVPFTSGVGPAATSMPGGAGTVTGAGSFNARPAALMLGCVAAGMVIYF